MVIQMPVYDYDLKTKICLNCQAVFKPENRTQKYCSCQCWQSVRKTQIIGINNPNYGRKHTEEELKIMREKHYNCSGSNNPLYGIGHTEATKNKLRLIHQGKILSEEAKQKISQGLKQHWATHKHPSIGLSPSLETRKKLSEALKGEKCYLWKGGTSNEPYPFEFNHKLKESIRIRDNYECQLCSTPQNGNRLSIHHIDYNKRNINPPNLISLCSNCHSKTNTKRDKWQLYFTTLLYSRRIDSANI